MKRLLASCFVLAIWLGSVQADTYHYVPGQTVVGNLGLITAEKGDTFIKLARKFRVGFIELVSANPHLDPWLLETGDQVVIPTQYILPDVEHEGIVLNLAELRLYYFPPGNTDTDQRMVTTYPISVGSGGQWETPSAFTRVIGKRENPSWYPPASILKEHEEKNDPLPRVVPPGPDNPLGDYAIRLGLPGYLIHGTNVPEGIGMRVTHGCVRLHPNDIEQLFSKVSIDMPVAIINQPYKVGKHGGVIYMETHPSQEEHAGANSRNLTEFVQAVIQQTQDHGEDQYKVDWERGYREARSKTGVPFPIATKSIL